METETIGIILAIMATTFLVAILVYLYAFRNNGEEVVIPDVDRHEYPKKDCECDCLGESKTETTDGELSESYSIEDINRINKHFKKEAQRLDRGYVSATVDIPGMYSSDPNIIHTSARCKEYMRRGNKRYFRGYNIKVVITVK